MGCTVVRSSGQRVRRVWQAAGECLMTCFTRPITALRQMVYAACWPPMLILCHKPFVNLTVGTVVTILHAACASHA